MWQGWLVFGAFFALVAAGFVLFRVFPPQEALIAYLIYVVMLSGVLVGICWLKGEPPSWRWRWAHPASLGRDKPIWVRTNIGKVPGISDIPARYYEKHDDIAEDLVARGESDQYFKCCRRLGFKWRPGLFSFAILFCQVAHVFTPHDSQEGQQGPSLSEPSA